jgi:hypothetical protein
MNEPPVAQYMILCEDARFEGDGPGRLNLYGVILRLSARGAAFPMHFPNLCAVLALRNGRGTGTGQVQGVHADTGLVVCRSAPRRFDFGNNPLQFRGAFFRMKNTVFPAAGAYTVEFRYDGILLATQSFDVVEGRS